jgi:hypothetical protein
MSEFPADDCAGVALPESDRLQILSAEETQPQATAAVSLVAGNRGLISVSLDAVPEELAGRGKDTAEARAHSQCPEPARGSQEPVHAVESTPAHHTRLSNGASQYRVADLPLLRAREVKAPVPAIQAILPDISCQVVDALRRRNRGREEIGDVPREEIGDGRNRGRTTDNGA